MSFGSVSHGNSREKARVLEGLKPWHIPWMVVNLISDLPPKPNGMIRFPNVNTNKNALGFNHGFIWVVRDSHGCRFQPSVGVPTWKITPFCLWPILWMGEILHQLRKPGMIHLQLPTNNGVSTMD